MTKEELIAHLKNLTDNQNSLIETINDLKRRADDPFIHFKTPDPIKNLPIFKGNKKEAQAWVEDVENTLDLFETYKDSPMYPQIVRAVKSKIVEEAKEILIAAGNPNTWEEIKEAILNSYGDRRDLTSHIQSLFYIEQGRKSITEFYNKMKGIDTAIKATASTMDDYKDSTRAINKLISLVTVTRFVDGLNENVSMHVRSCGPKTLEEAYNTTMQFSNAAFRTKLNENKSTKPQMPNRNQNHYQPGPSKQFNKPASGNFKQGSGKFKNFKNPQVDDDVSMRTAKPRADINNHEGKHENIEHDTAREPDDSVIESDDDDYFVDDELNFLVGEVMATKE